MPGTQGALNLGRKKASSLAAISCESLACTAFMVVSVPNAARILCEVGERGEEGGRR